MILQQSGGARGRQITEPLQHRIVIGCRPVGIELVSIGVIVEGIGAGKQGICLFINVGMAAGFLAHAASLEEIDPDNKGVIGCFALLAGCSLRA